MWPNKWLILNSDCYTVIHETFNGVQKKKKKKKKKKRKEKKRAHVRLRMLLTQYVYKSYMFTYV